MKRCYSFFQIIDFSSSISVEEGETWHRGFYSCYQHVTDKAPEVILQAPLTTAVDIFSAGCILYKMAFGQSLFYGKITLLQTLIHEHFR